MLNILFKIPQDFELKSKRSGILDNRVFTLKKDIVSVESEKADDNGNLIKFHH